MKTLYVVAAVIVENNKIFSAQRPNKGEVGLKWEFPGGKIEPGEKEEDALRREIIEEFDTTLKIGNKITTISHQYKDFEIIMSAYLCNILNGNLLLKEHVDSKWLTLETIKNVDWAPADIPIVDELLKQEIFN